MAPSETHCKCVTNDCIAVGVVFVLTLYLCLCAVLSVDLLWVGVVSVDWSVVCVVCSVAVSSSVVSCVTCTHSCFHSSVR